MTHTLVVGGTHGIGRAVSRRFAAEGHTVSVVGRREPPEAELPNVTCWRLDLADGEQLATRLDEILEAQGPLRNVVLLQRFRGEPGADSWQGELGVSLTATKTVLERAAVGFEPGGGSIVLACSNASRLVAGEQPVAYHAAKAALGQMARYYAVVLGPSAIRVNCVTPGTVLKEESREAYLASPWSEAVRAATPLGRLGSPEDIASAVAFLCGDGASFVTGHELVVDGGLSLLWQESLLRTAMGGGNPPDPAAAP